MLQAKRFGAVSAAFEGEGEDYDGRSLDHMVWRDQPAISSAVTLAPATST